MTPDPRVRDRFPYPVAVPYALVFDAGLSATDRRWALGFTQYQALRLITLALVGQYLRRPIDTTAEKAVKAVSECVAALRSPMFSDWVTAVRTLPDRWPALGLSEPFPTLRAALGRLKAAKAERSVGLSGRHRLDPLEAIQALRNGTAHGGIPDQAAAERQLAEYVPVLHEVLDAFAFLTDCTLLVCDEPGRAEQGLTAAVRTLRGTAEPTPADLDPPPALAEAFAASAAVLVAPDGTPLPLDPLAAPLSFAEPLYLYDGHHGIRVTAKTAADVRYVYYLGVREKHGDTSEGRAAADRLRDLLAARRISYDLPKERVAPWTVAEAALDYSRRTVAELLGKKYFPDCYVPFPDADTHLDRFLTTPDRSAWAAPDRPRYRNGLIVTGEAGAGKTALLARRVNALVNPPRADAGPADPDADRANPNVVLFLRGDGIARGGESVSLFRDVAEKLGVSVADRGIGSFAELLAHLHPGFAKDKVPGRRLVLVLDALNEAPSAEAVTREALELVTLAARYPWCKVVVSTRAEWLTILPEKMAANEADPRAAVRDHLYDPDPTRPGADRRLPALTLEPPTEDHTAAIYGRFQARERAGDRDAGAYAVPACRTPWDQLSADVRRLLRNPLYVYLFMEAFRGREAGAVASVPELYERYVEAAKRERNVGPSLAAVAGYLLSNPGRPTADLTDDDAHAIRAAWAAGRTADEARRELSPVECLVHEGFVRKRVGEEGGGYRFVYQTVAEYLIYSVLRDGRQDGADELAHWQRLVRPEIVFPEYAGAFQFLLRNWEGRTEARPWVGPLVGGGAPWAADALSSTIEQLAQTDFQPGIPSFRVARLTAVLHHPPLEPIGDLLAATSLRLMSTPYAPTAEAICRACVAVREWLVTANPDRTGIATDLAVSLSNLGLLLQARGQIGDAEAAMRRGVEVYEALLATHPRNPNIADGLIDSLRNLGILLGRSGRADRAFDTYARGVTVYESILGAVDSTNDGQARRWNKLGCLLESCGRIRDAASASQRSVAIYDAMPAAQHGEVEIAIDLAIALNNHGNSLINLGCFDEAESAYRRSVAIREKLYTAAPGSDEIANGLTMTLRNLSLHLQASGKTGEGAAMLQRAVAICESQYTADPNRLSAANRLVVHMHSLGHMLYVGIGNDAAPPFWRRVVDICEAMHTAAPTHVDITRKLAESLRFLGMALENVHRPEDAYPAYRRRLVVREQLYVANPADVDITLDFAEAISDVRRFSGEYRSPDEAQLLVDGVLNKFPQHERANHLNWSFDMSRSQLARLTAPSWRGRLRAFGIRIVRYMRRLYGRSS